MDYKLGIPLESSEPEGNSDSLSMSLNFPSFNLGKLTTSINFGISNNTYLNKTNAGISSEKSNFKGNLDLNFNIVDQIFGGGANNFTISMTKGELDLGDTPSNLASDQSAAKTNGDFEKFTINFSRLQSLSSKHALFFSTIIRNRVIKDLKESIYNKIIVLPIDYFSKNKKGDLIARMSSDVIELQNSFL